ncbi:OmpA family protein [Spirosoma sp.]|uniref:OmpA family protein n=1 Tax=Spirosoma sp. TaxID=1899569 RepID=UPI003B3B9711
MRLLIIFLFSLTLCQVVCGQDRILTTDSISISCRIESVTSQHVRYTNLSTNRLDSLPTLSLRELVYADSRRLLVVPASERDQMRTVAFADFEKALRRDQYVTLLHTKAIKYDLTFLNGKTTLTTEGRRQALALAALLKTKPANQYSIAIHTDTLGKAITNKELSDRRAVALRNFLVANGLDGQKLTVEGRGESEEVSRTQSLNRRIEMQVISIDGVKELYGEIYTPKSQMVSTTPTPTPVTENSSPAANSNRYVTSWKTGKLGAVVYAEGLYALESMSKTWVNPEQGIGILQGFGGGLMLNYFLTARFALTLQGGYGQWAVQRRYRTDDGEVVFTNDQSLKRILAQVGFRLYMLPAVYLQPMGGGQFLTLTSQNSEAHPEGTLQSETKKFMPTFGGALGFELGKKSILVDIAAQYQMTPNTNFGVATEPLHYAGLRLGIGFRPRTH